MFLCPALFFYFAFIIYPVLVTFFNSFHILRQDLGLTYQFVGLQHFKEILGSDEVFWRAARNSLTWAIVAPIVDMPLALTLAFLLHSRSPSPSSSARSGSRRSSCPTPWWA